MKIEETVDGDLDLGNKLAEGLLMFPTSEQEHRIIQHILANKIELQDFLNKITIVDE